LTVEACFASIFEVSTKLVLRTAAASKETTETKTQQPAAAKSASPTSQEVAAKTTTKPLRKIGSRQIRSETSGWIEQADGNCSRRHRATRSAHDLAGQLVINKVASRKSAPACVSN